METWQVTVYLEDGSTREMEYLPERVEDMTNYILMVATTYKGVLRIEIVHYYG